MDHGKGFDGKIGNCGSFFFFFFSRMSFGRVYAYIRSAPISNRAEAEGGLLASQVKRVFPHRLRIMYHRNRVFKVDVQKNPSTET